MFHSRRSKASPHARLTLLYIAALSTVALLSIVAQVLVQRQLTLGESDSRVINYAGRQRMLSQRLAKAALMVRNRNSSLRDTALEELAETRDIWTRSHKALLNGGDFGLPGKNSKTVEQLFASINTHYIAMADAAEALSGPLSPDRLAQQIEIINTNEAMFLQGMDAIVSQYVAEAESKTDRLRHLETYLLAITLGILFIEGVWIFRPAVKRIQQTNERLRRARNEAKRANLAKSRFLANVSHELRTPMTAVLGSAELARAQSDPQQKDKYLGTIEEAGSVLLGLLNNLIDLAQIEADCIKLDEQSFDAHQLAETVADMVRVMAEKNGVEVRMESLGDVDLSLLGDSQRLKQILLNLMTNAVKWTDEGHVSITAKVQKVSPTCASLCYVVRDTGVGIAESQLARVFQPFEQGDMHRKRGGIGLGLAICRRIADAMQGTLQLSSIEGEGTTATFQVELQIVGKSLRRDDQQLDRSQLASPKRVLVVEDDPLNQSVLKDILSQANHVAHLCTTGEQAIDAYQQQSFDVVVTDKHLPGISGVEATKRMKDATPVERRKMVRFVSLSADRATTETECLYDVVLPKPIATRDLLAAIVGDLCGDVDADSSEQFSKSLNQELIATYLQFAPTSRQQLREAIESEEWRQATVLAHRLRGQVGNFDQPLLAEKLRELEKACESESGATVQRLINEIVSDLENLERVLSSKLGLTTVP